MNENPRAIRPDTHLEQGPWSASVDHTEGVPILLHFPQVPQTFSDLFLRALFSFLPPLLATPLPPLFWAPFRPVLPSKSALLCRAKSTGQILERGSFRMNLFLKLNFLSEICVKKGQFCPMHVWGVESEEKKQHKHKLFRPDTRRANPLERAVFPDPKSLC